jgi:cell division protein FtsW
LHLENLWTWSWKSVQNFCRNPHSDFIYAIIVEMYAYRWLWCSNFIFIALVSICCSLAQSQYALWKVSRRWTRFSDDFSSDGEYGCSGRVMPVTGQTLPLISSGGSSIWMTCFALGIIISVTKR